jgi:NADPH:quinone reductase-like Zn-dependent oxidoreductase
VLTNEEQSTQPLARLSDEVVERLAVLALRDAAVSRTGSTSFARASAAGRSGAPRYRAELRRDLRGVLQLLLAGAIDAQVARRFPLRDAGQALRYAENGGIVGKVVLEP